MGHAGGMPPRLRLYFELPELHYWPNEELRGAALVAGLTGSSRQVLQHPFLNHLPVVKMLHSDTAWVSPSTLPIELDLAAVYVLASVENCGVTFTSNRCPCACLVGCSAAVSLGSSSATTTTCWMSKWRPWVVRPLRLTCRATWTRLHCVLR